MSLAVAGRKRQTVQTARRLAECSSFLWPTSATEYSVWRNVY